MNTNEVLKLALEALENAEDQLAKPYSTGARYAITALREALAEHCICGEPNTPGTHRTDGPCLAEQKSGIKQVIELYDSPHQPSQQEPVVWMYVNKSTHETKFQKHMRDFVDHGLWAEVPLYGEPLANQELNCVCGAVWQGDELVHLPRKPASKPWVGLTDEEIDTLREKHSEGRGAGWRFNFKGFAKAIEAKLKEKNT